MTPFFTVIICVYNRAELLPRAISSLLRQSYTDFEAVIVDDGSTDATPDVIQNYALKHPNLRTIRLDTNSGVSTARNAAIDSGKGLFVTFLDSDDEYEPDHLQSRYQMLVENDHVRFLHGGAKVVGDPWVVDMNDPSKKIHLSNCVVGGTFVIRRDVFEEIGTFDHAEYADDTLFYQKAQRRGIVIAQTTHESYIYYRNTPNQLTSAYAG